MRLVLACACAVLGALISTTPGFAADLRHLKAENETLKEVDVVAPAGEVKAIVGLISDMDGWTPARQAEAEALANAGAAVVEIDLPKYLDALLKTTTGPCLYMSGDVEDYARLAGKTLNMKDYKLPVLIGVGKGGDVAYAMLAQAPLNMFSGAVSVGFTDRVPVPKPLCDGPPSSKQDGPDLIVGNDTKEPLQGEWRVLTQTPLSDDLQAFVKKFDNAEIVEEAADADMATQAREAALDIGGSSSTDSLKSLPLVVYPPKNPNPRGLVVFYAGDGGWRDLDKQVAAYFEQEGYGIVGIDTLRYFWSEKTPRQLGDDLEAILKKYTGDWKTNRVMVAGYSFGADVIPFAWQHLSKPSKDQIKLMALLGLSKTADFEVSVAGWLGVGSGEHDVLKPASSLPMDRVLCVYGKEELEDKDNDVACATDVIPPKARLELPGAHHYDQDYASLARKIDAEFAKRTGLKPPATPDPNAKSD